MIRAYINATTKAVTRAILGSKLNILPNVTKDKFLFLWTGKIGQNQLLNDLGTDAIGITNKDFTGNIIPASSNSTFAMPNTQDYKDADLDGLWFKDGFGDNIIVNGTFDTDTTNWTKGPGVTISGGVCNFNISAGNIIYQSIGTANQNKLLRVTCSLTITSGSIRFEFGGVNGNRGTERLTSGTYVEIIDTKDFNGNFIFVATAVDKNTVGAIDNVIVEEVLTDIQQQVAVGELVSLNYTRTFVKYNDNAPHDVSVMGILKSGETLTDYDKDKISNLFRLWVLYFSEWNDNGFLKENR